MERTIGTWISTRGRNTLRRAMHSIATQSLIEGDQVLIMGDGPVPSASALCDEFGPPFRYVETALTSDYGHSQANIALSMLESDYVVGQDDDDVFAPRAYEVIREKASFMPMAPMLFRFISPDGRWLPDGAHGNATHDGHCLVLPNIKKRIGGFKAIHP